MKPNSSFLSWALVGCVGAAAVGGAIWWGLARAERAALPEVGPASGRAGETAGGGVASGPAAAGVKGTAPSPGRSAGGGTASGAAPRNGGPASGTLPPSPAENAATGSRSGARPATTSGGPTGPRRDDGVGRTSITWASQDPQRRRSVALFEETWPLDDATRDALGQAIADYERDPSNKEGFDRFRQGNLERLGAERGEAFNALFFAAPYLPVAEDFAARCAAQGEAPSPATLTAIAITLRRLPDPEYTAAPRRPDGTLVAEELAMTEAAKVLTPGQLRIFKEVWAEKPYPFKR